MLLRKQRSLDKEEASSVGWKAYQARVGNAKSANSSD